MKGGKDGGKEGSKRGREEGVENQLIIEAFHVSIKTDGNVPFHSRVLSHSCAHVNFFRLKQNKARQ